MLTILADTMLAASRQQLVGRTGRPVRPADDLPDPWRGDVRYPFRIVRRRDPE